MTDEQNAMLKAVAGVLKDRLNGFTSGVRKLEIDIPAPNLSIDLGSLTDALTVIGQRDAQLQSVLMSLVDAVKSNQKSMMDGGAAFSQVSSSNDSLAAAIAMLLAHMKKSDEKHAAAMASVEKRLKANDAILASVAASLELIANRPKRTIEIVDSDGKKSTVSEA